MGSIFQFPIFKFAWNYIYKQLDSTNEKKHILEPLSTVLKLALISYEEEGTKIGICGNSIYIQRPNLLQGTIRYMNGNNREEIHYLLRPIIRCVDLYPAKDDANIQYIYDLAVEGLKKLQRSYGNISSNVCYTIDLYIAILKGKHKVDIFENDDLHQGDTTIFKDLWEIKDITLIANLFSSSYLVSVQNIINIKEKTFEDTLKKNVY